MDAIFKCCMVTELCNGVHLSLTWLKFHQSTVTNTFTGRTMQWMSINWHKQDMSSKCYIKSCISIKHIISEFFPLFHIHVYCSCISFCAVIFICITVQLLSIFILILHMISWEILILWVAKVDQIVYLPIRNRCHVGRDRRILVVLTKTITYVHLQ